MDDNLVYMKKNINVEIRFYSNQVSERLFSYFEKITEKQSQFKRQIDTKRLTLRLVFFDTVTQQLFYVHFLSKYRL